MTPNPRSKTRSNPTPLPPFDRPHHPEHPHPLLPNHHRPLNLRHLTELKTLDPWESISEDAKIQYPLRIASTPDRAKGDRGFVLKGSHPSSVAGIAVEGRVRSVLR